MASFPPLYPILDVAACEGRGLDPLRVAAEFVAAGARILQLRDKSRGSGATLLLADRLVALTAGAASVIVNDRADIARLAGAAGVHVGQEDLPVERARALLGADAVVGVSTHDERQVDEALASTAEYVAVGPIFDTSTKATGYSARGLGLVRYASGRGKPVVAIGGITLERVAAVLDAGADAVAIISDLLAAHDIAARTRAYLERCGGYPPG